MFELVSTIIIGIVLVSLAFFVLIDSIIGFRDSKKDLGK